MLVLGQPGSRKSVLTRVLAARLPAEDFLTVRVELRQVPAELDLQSQIELAVREATGESVPWPRLVESVGGALPVVILDGFDELLQATGAHQTDFLVKVAAFQQREADQGRPVAVIVTSRVAVADRATPPPGSRCSLSRSATTRSPRWPPVRRSPTNRAQHANQRRHVIVARANRRVDSISPASGSARCRRPRVHAEWRPWRIISEYQIAD